MSPDTIPREVIIAALRSNLPLFAIACVVLVAGICSLLLARLRLRDRLLLWVGVFSLFYAARLLVRNELVRAAFHAPGREYLPWDLCLTYIVPIPFALFARELLGHGWKRAIDIWLWAQVAFAVVAIPTALLAHQVYGTEAVNGVLIVTGTLVVLAHLFVRRKAANSFAAPLTWPLLVFGLLIVFQNRGVFGLGSRAVGAGGMDLEPLGFLILLAGLGVTAARRALARERKLVDVENELATARRIQNSIIPDAAPIMKSLSLAARYQPMTSVAGDFYDFLKTGEYCLTILVADVSGHGVPAALVASTLKVCFAAQRAQSNDPAAILLGLNAMLRGSLGGQYVTAACAAIDTEARVITYAGAGHPPALLLRRNTRDIVQLAENGLFIGPFPNSAYSNISVPLQTGDKLLLYTDGIVEATGPDDQEFGRDRLQQFLIETADQDPAAVVDSLFQRISTDPQQDDLTAVLAEFG